MSTRRRAGAACVLLAAVAASASAQTSRRRCGTPPLTAQQRAAVEAATSQRMSAFDVSAARVAGSVSIPVWFHVINKGTGISNGDLPTSMLSEQVNVLNSSFNGTTGGANTPFRFFLAGVKRRTNATLFDACADSARAAEVFSGRVGGAETLNVVTCNPASLFGFAYYPWWYSQSPATDGMVIHYGTFPGSTWEPFNRGDTSVHEAGHWLGLYHTFEGGCTTTNDQVADTPAEAAAHYGCPAGLDSCPSLPGPDPLRNFMSYFDDDCIWEFTAGQSSRMDTQHATYRFSGTSTPRPTPTPTPTATARTTPTPTRTPTPTPTPAAGCGSETFTGTLSAAGAEQIQPSSGWYQSTAAGTHVGCLAGPGGADFDLYLDRWSGGAWTQAAASEGVTATETITYAGTAGYYRWRIRSYAGTGSYTFRLRRP